MMGMPRRVATYPDLPGWAPLNQVATIGSFIILLGVIAFVWNVIVSYRDRQPLGDDPWNGAYTLEWATSSPPPEHNFHRMPPIRSERPAFDLHFPEIARQTL
jgi:heme/copper-type cytochrome/quinol oxidase subunit 1